MKAVNLIPSEERSHGGGIPKGRSGGAVFVVFGLLGGLVLMAFLYGLADHQISTRRGEVATLAARAQRAQAQASALAPYTSFLQMHEQREQAVATLVASRFDWAQAFHELSRVLPPGKVSLSAIEGSIGAAGTSAGKPGASAAPAAATPASSSSTAAGGSSQVTSATPPGAVPTFKLSGCATSQEEVALMLQRLRLVEGVKEVSLQSSTASGSSAAGAGSGSASGGSCPGGAPVFAAQIVFAPLPAAPATGSGSSAATGGAASSSASRASASAGASATVATGPTTTGATR